MINMSIVVVITNKYSFGIYLNPQDMIFTKKLNQFLVYKFTKTTKTFSVLVAQTVLLNVLKVQMLLIITLE